MPNQQGLDSIKDVIFNTIYKKNKETNQCNFITLWKKLNK